MGKGVTMKEKQAEVEQPQSRGWAACKMKMVVGDNTHIIEADSMFQAVTLMKQKCKELGVKQAQIPSWEKA